MIYNQQSVPVEIWQKFPSLRDKPPQAASTANSQIISSFNQQYPTQYNNLQRSTNKNNEYSLQSQKPQTLPLDTLKDMFPDVSSIQKQSICQTNSQYIPANASSILTTQAAWNSIRDPVNQSLRKKEYAPETLPMSTQITMNKTTCSLCSRNKRCQLGEAGDGTISHITPVHMLKDA